MAADQPVAQTSICQLEDLCRLPTSNWRRSGRGLPTSGRSCGITIRFATADDVSLLLQLIRELAAYERAPDAVVATEDDLRRYGFGPEPRFEALLASLDGEPAGTALFHSRFSTWLGCPGLYLEDLYVTEAARGLGVGRRLMARLAAIATERGWGRIDFHVLD